MTLIRRRMRTASSAALVIAVVVGVAGCGGGDDSPTRTYSLAMHTDDSSQEYEYVADEPFDIQVGDEVTFEMDNTGALVHDLQIVDPEGQAVGTAAPVAPGDTLTLTVRFDEAGLYRLNCLVDNHLTEHSMQAIIEVTEADA